MISASTEATLESISTRCKIGEHFLFKILSKTLNFFSSSIISHQILQIVFTEQDIRWLPTLLVVFSMLAVNDA